MRVYERIITVPVPTIAGTARVWFQCDETLPVMFTEVEKVRQVIDAHPGRIKDLIRAIADLPDVAAVEVRDEFSGYVIYNDWP